MRVTRALSLYRDTPGVSWVGARKDPSKQEARGGVILRVSVKWEDLVREL